MCTALDLTLTARGAASAVSEPEFQYYEHKKFSKRRRNSANCTESSLDDGMRSNNSTPITACNAQVYMMPNDCQYKYFAADDGNDTAVFNGYEWKYEFTEHHQPLTPLAAQQQQYHQPLVQAASNFGLTPENLKYLQELDNLYSANLAASESTNFDNNNNNISQTVSDETYKGLENTWEHMLYLLSNTQRKVAALP